MLQQTQVETMLPYFERWMKRFPSVADVAKANEEAVLKGWEGLGYYSRARNLHRAARELVAHHGGQLPEDPVTLCRLPGIGRYTAGAIASIGFNRAAPVVDGNVARVLSRFHTLPAAPGSREGAAALWQIAETIVPRRDARNFNQALMELGALVCRKAQPDCPKCPLRGGCGAVKAGDPSAFPVRAMRRARPTEEGTLWIWEWEGFVLLRKRLGPGVWRGLWEFPWMVTDPASPRHGGFPPFLDPPLHQALSIGRIAHGLTHVLFDLHCHHLRAPAPREIPTPEMQRETENSFLWQWTPITSLEALPKARLTQKARGLLSW